VACGCGPKYVNRARVSCKDMNAGEACFSRATNAYTYTQVYAHAHTHTHTQALAHAYTHKRAQPLTHPPTPRYIHIHTNERNHPPTPRHTHTCTRRVGCCSLEALLRTPGHQPPWFSNQGVFVGVWVGEWVGGPGGGDVFVFGLDVSGSVSGRRGMGYFCPPHLCTMLCQAGMHSASQSLDFQSFPHLRTQRVARLAYTLHRKASLFFCLPHSHTALAHILPGRNALRNTELHFIH
jgi:hypothetical protein